MEVLCYDKSAVDLCQVDGARARAMAKGGGGALGTADFSFASLADSGSTPSFLFLS